MIRLMTAIAGLVSVLASAGCSRARGSAITEPELVRRTQELFDAVAAGDRGPWEKYYAEDCLYFDEKGRSMDKKALVEDQKPLPAGFSGKIILVGAKSRIFPETAILSYDLDETETVFGQVLKARYHGTDTWLLRNGEWKITAGQVLRYYEDPAPGTLDVRRATDYAGTYELAPGRTLVVSAEAGNLFSQRVGRSKETLIPEAGDVFFRKGVEGRIVFRRDAGGRVGTLLDRRNNEDILWKRIR